MIASRRGGGLLAVFLASVLLSCGTTTKEIFPQTGSIRLRILDSGLAFQNSASSNFQAITWEITSATVDIEGFGPWDFFQGAGPCTFSDNLLTSDDVERACRGSGVVLDPGPRNVTVHVRIASILLRHVVIPDLSPEGDYDGDGQINRYDNCILYANPDQEDANGDGIGDPCSIEVAGTPTSDADRDGIADTLDDCPFVADPEQADVRRGADFIGDACEVFTPADLPDGSLEMDVPAVLVVQSSGAAVLTFDFNDRLAFDCNASRTVCRLDPARILFSVR